MRSEGEFDRLFAMKLVHGEQACGEPRQRESAGHDIPDPDIRAVAIGHVIRSCLGENLDQGVLKKRRIGGRNQVEGTRGVSQYNPGLDAGKIVEEPGTRREHGQAVPLDFERTAVAQAIGTSRPLARDDRAQFRGKRFQAYPERRTPILAGGGIHAATTFRTPPLHAVRTTPRGG